MTGDRRQQAADQHEAGQATGTATGEGARRVCGRREARVDGRLCQRPRQHPGNGNLMPRPEFEAGQRLQHELRPRHSSLNLTCCLFYFQTRFNVVYIYTILVPIIHPPISSLCKCKWRFVNSPQQHHHHHQHHHQHRHQHQHNHHCLCPFYLWSEHNESTGSMGFALLFTAHFSSVLRQGHTHTHTYTLAYTEHPHQITPCASFVFAHSPQFINLFSIFIRSANTKLFKTSEIDLISDSQMPLKASRVPAFPSSARSQPHSCHPHAYSKALNSRILQLCPATALLCDCK